MLNNIILIGLIIDLIAVFLMYYGKIFRSVEKIEQMTEDIHENKHRILETRLARIDAIFLIAGFFIQIIGYM